MMGALREGFAGQQESTGLAIRLSAQHPHAVTGESLLHLLIQISGVKRLDEKTVGAGLETGRHLLRTGVGTDDQDRHIPGEWAVAETANEIERVEAGKRSVHEDQVKGTLSGLMETFLLAAGNHDVASTGPFEYDADSLEGDWIVVYNQHITEAIGARGNGNRAFDLPGGRRLGGRLGPVDIGARHAGIIA